MWPALLVGAAAAFLLGGCSGSSSHSLHYFSMGVSEPGQGLLQFIIVGYVDDQLFAQYDSDTKKALPRAPWMEMVGKEDPRYWDRETGIFQNSEQWFRDGLASSSSSSSHSLRYFYTSVSEPGQGLPRFIIVGYVDDQLHVQYDSNTKKALPRAPWMEMVGKDNPQYWDGQTQISRDQEQQFRVDLGTLRRYYNQTGGFHTWQWMYGCELRGDGSKEGYMQYAYDGRDYLCLDKETLTWTAADPQAQISKRKLEAEPAFAQSGKAYLEEICTEWLQRYLGYGKETLLRAEPPMVKVTRQVEHDGTETLVCRAHGFHPKAIEATWRKDGEVLEHETFRRDVTPNSDGTYHTWLSIQIDPKDRDHYRCHVEHDGLLEPLDVSWEETGASNLGLIIGGVAGAAVILLVAVILGIYFCKKRQVGYKAALTRDQNSDSSGSNPAI